MKIVLIISQPLLISAQNCVFYFVLTYGHLFLFFDIYTDVCYTFFPYILDINHSLNFCKDGLSSRQQRTCQVYEQNILVSNISAAFNMDKGKNCR